MTKKAKPKKLRLKGVHLPKEVKRCPKKFLRVPGKLQKEHTQRREKALLKIPVKPTQEKPIETPTEPVSKPMDFGIKPIQPDEIEKILESMQHQESKKVEEKLRQKKYNQAWKHAKEWFIQHLYQWDWKSVTSVTALVIIGLLALIVIFKVYLGTTSWEEDAQNIKIPEDQLFQAKTSEAEKTIDRLREKVDATYQQETGKSLPTLPRSTSRSSSTSSFPSQMITKQPNYVRTGSPSTVPGTINENVIRKFLADAGDLYYMIPKDGQFHIGFYDSTGDPIQNLMFYAEGGFIATGRSRGTEFTLYISQGYANQLATTTDPCALVMQIYNSKSYQFTSLRSELYLRQKYGGMLRNIQDCRNRES